jgi:uncharacterized protein
VKKVALLDVSVLVALFDPDHVHHDVAHDWFAGQRQDGWATCPITENGLLRVLSNPRYGAVTHRPPELLALLRQFCESGHHNFWPDTLSLCEARQFDAAAFRGHAQLTDVYLLGLAAGRRGRLATFDRTIPLAAVRGASRDNLEVIAPSE